MEVKVYRRGNKVYVQYRFTAEEYATMIRSEVEGVKSVTYRYVFEYDTAEKAKSEAEIFRKRVHAVPATVTLLVDKNLFWRMMELVDKLSRR